MPPGMEKESMRSCCLSWESEGGLRRPTQFPEAQLGHIENILIFVLAGPLRLLLGEGGRVKFIERNMNQWERQKPRSSGSHEVVRRQKWLGVGGACK